jgi:surface polysaccharide O-acyltransferase-like enzyme
LIRAVAVGLVVVLHATGSLMRIPGTVGVVNLGVHVFTRICVPLFVMLSGWLLFNESRAAESAGVFLRRHLWRVGWPLLVWSGFYAGWRIGYYGESRQLLYWLGALADSSVYYHLWFLYLMLGLYCTVPLLRPLLSSQDKLIVPLLFALWLVSILLPPLLHRLLGVEWTFGHGLPFDYLGYFLFGAWLGVRPLSRCQRRCAAATWVMGFIVTWIGTWCATAVNAPQSLAWVGYLRPNVILMSVSAFLLLTDWGNRHPAPPVIAPPVEWLARGSLGIYLLHPVILELGASGRLGSHVYALSRAEAGGRLVFAAVCLVSCGAVVSLACRIPALRPLVS